MEQDALHARARIEMAKVSWFSSFSILDALHARARIEIRCAPQCGHFFLDALHARARIEMSIPLP